MEPLAHNIAIVTLSETSALYHVLLGPEAEGRTILQALPKEIARGDMPQAELRLEV